MRFKDRVAWFLATLLVSASIAFSFPAIAAAATYYPCSGTVSDNYIGFVYRNVATYKAVSGRSIVQNVHGCTGSYSGTYGDFVFPANIEQVGGSFVPFVQLGYGQGSPSTSLQWFYSSRDNAADGSAVTNWLSPSIGQPQLNHQYEFDITQSVVGGLNYWTLTIKDLTAGTSMSRNITRNYSSANEVWYGIEVWTEADQFGGPSSSSPVQVTDMEYMDTSLAWSYVTYDNSNPCSSANGYRASYWQCWSSNDLNTHHSILTGYTVNH